MSQTVIHTNCRHYRTDRPCTPHKQHGVTCAGCRFHDAIEERILIIKLDAIGDVLRTTSILKPLKQKYPRAEVTWLTRRASLDLLLNNPFVEKKIAEIAPGLPPGVKVVPYYDRADLINRTITTVAHNLAEGAILVSVLLFLFLGDLRASLIVAAVIPFSMMAASSSRSTTPRSAGIKWD